MDKDISIYVPVYNGEKTIKACLDSILNQSLKPKKILVINDNSNDKTLDILNRYKDKIEIIHNLPNKGVTYSRDLAVNTLGTKYIASIDADVELEKYWLEKIYSSLFETKATLVGGKLYEKFVNNPYNFWRSIRLKQNWGEKNILNPKFVFGCNNILDTTKLNLKELYTNKSEYFKTNGEDVELSLKLRKNNHILYYNNDAKCYHLQDDNGLSLAQRYWRYIHWGDGLKKRNLFKTFKNIIRQIKKTFIWSYMDIIEFRFKLILVNFLLLYYFIILDFKFYFKNKK